MKPEKQFESVMNATVEEQIRELAILEYLTFLDEGRRNRRMNPTNLLIAEAAKAILGTAPEIDIFTDLILENTLAVKSVLTGGYEIKGGGEKNCVDL